MNDINKNLLLSILEDVNELKDTLQEINGKTALLLLLIHFQRLVITRFIMVSLGVERATT